MFSSFKLWKILTKDTQAGAHKGHVLGPLLFILFVGHNTDATEGTRIIKNVDDRMIYFAGKGLEVIKLSSRDWLEE